MTQPDLPDWISTIAVADSPQLLLTESGFHPSHGTSTIDVSPWSSVSFIFQSQCPNVNTLSDVQFNWFDNGVLIDTEHYTFWSSQVANTLTPLATLNVPCLGNQLSLTFTGSDATQTMQYSVYGSRRIVPKPLIHCDWLSCSPALIAYPSTVLNVSATQTFRFGPTHGPIYFQTVIAGSHFSILSSEVLSGGTFTEDRVVSISATNSSNGTDIYVPGCALKMDVTNNSTTNNPLTVACFPIQ